MTRLIANNFSTTLNGAITDTATSMTLTSVTGFPAVGSGDTCQVTLDDGTNIEIVTATAIAGSVITITRAQEGTTAVAFADLDPVEIRDTALLYTDVLASDTTPALSGHLELGTNTMYGSGGSSTTYHFGTTGGVPYMRGAANYEITFTSSSVDFQAGTTWYAVQMHNSNGFSVTTNNVVRIQANNSGVQFGATGARITSVADEDNMVSDSATLLCTQQSIKAYVDAASGGSFTASSTDTLTNKTIDANGTGNSISNIDIADLANGTDGELITWDAAGAPAAVAVGTAGHILKSGGVGVAPTFQAADTLAADTYLLVQRTTTQSINNATFTKVLLATEDTDAAGDFDNVTDYRHTPSTAGYYLYFCSAAMALGDQDKLFISIRKNGTDALTGINFLSSGSGTTIYSAVNGVLYMNGTTDYVELWVYHDYGSARDINGDASRNYMLGVLLS